MNFCLSRLSADDSPLEHSRQQAAALTEKEIYVMSLC